MAHASVVKSVTPVKAIVKVYLDEPEIKVVQEARFK